MYKCFTNEDRTFEMKCKEKWGKFFFSILNSIPPTFEFFFYFTCIHLSDVYLIDDISKSSHMCARCWTKCFKFISFFSPRCFAIHSDWHRSYRKENKLIATNKEKSYLVLHTIDTLSQCIYLFTSSIDKNNNDLSIKYCKFACPFVFCCYFERGSSYK